MLKKILKQWRFIKAVKSFREILSKKKSIQEKVEEVLLANQFKASQKNSEITSLLQTLQKMKAKRICEIGAFNGGTLALFSAIAPQDAKIISIDLNYSTKQIRAFPYFANHNQQVVCLSGDSQAPATVAEFEKWLQSEQLDFLFIDGDHSYPGVSKDFDRYSPYVRPGGCIIFHDIVEDFKTRYGTETQAYTGGVPTFWKEIKQAHQTTEELIDNPEQDGFGIGILWWKGTTGRPAI